MCRGIYAALVIATMITTGVDAQQSDHKVKKTIELTRRDGKLEFVERGKDSTEPVTIVVGDSVRWENKDNEPHTVMSALTIDGRPLFDTGVIKPGEYVDLLFDIDLYERAGGRPANVVALQYHSDEQVDEYGVLRVLSAARR
jgi:hypothetical protein